MKRTNVSLCLNLFEGRVMQPEYSIKQLHQAKYIALALVIFSLLSVFGMLHHPSVSATDVNEQIQELIHESQLNAFVHVVMISLSIMINLCLTYYAVLRGIGRTSIMSGLVIYWLGTIAMVTAVLTSAFVSPQLAQHYQLASAEQLEVFKGLTTMSHLFNQAFANFGVVCWCVTMLCWSFDMIRQGGTIKLFGVLSFLAALVISISLFSGYISLSVFGMTLVLAAICAWQLGIAWLMYNQTKA